MRCIRVGNSPCARCQRARRACVFRSTPQSPRTGAGPERRSPPETERMSDSTQQEPTQVTSHSFRENQTPRSSDGEAIFRKVSRPRLGYHSAGDEEALNTPPLSNCDQTTQLSDRSHASVDLPSIYSTSPFSAIVEGDEQSSSLANQRHAAPSPNTGTTSTTSPQGQEARLYPLDNEDPITSQEMKQLVKMYVMADSL